MKFGVVIFPGSNCDHDMIYVLKDIMKQDVIELWHKDKNLKNVDAVIFPGGFSFGDYLRSGAIARFSPIMEKVIPFAASSNISVFISVPIVFVFSKMSFSFMNISIEYNS